MLKKLLVILLTLALILTAAIFFLRPEEKPAGAPIQDEVQTEEHSIIEEVIPETPELPPGPHIGEIALLECAPDKNQAIETICKPRDNRKECARGVAMVYLFYLLKTDQVKNSELISEIISENSEPQMSGEAVKGTVDKFLTSDDMDPGSPEDMKIWKTESAEIIDSEDDELIKQYLSGIDAYKSASSPVDCGNIETDAANSRLRYLLDACLLTFEEDLDALCETV